MRGAVMFSLAFLACVSANSQVANEFQRSSPRMIAYGSLPENEIVEEVQKNFINQVWRAGTVYFKGAPNKFEAPLLFDVYSNKLYFLRDSLIMEFAQPVQQFTITILSKKDTLDVLYRSVYPAIHKNTDETFYEVLIDGKFQLLKCKAKTIGLYKDKGIPVDERNPLKEVLYTYLPNGKIVQVKAEKEYVLKEMVEYADAIQKICSDKKLKLKNETQLKELFFELNRFQ